MTIGEVKRFNVKNARCATTPLEAIATITETSSQPVLERKNRLNSVTINAISVGRASGSISDDIKNELKKRNSVRGPRWRRPDLVKIKTIYRQLVYGGRSGILLIYLIMVALNESIEYAFVVLFSLPVAIIGAILALALTLHTINLFLF